MCNIASVGMHWVCCESPFEISSSMLLNSCTSSLYLACIWATFSLSCFLKVLNCCCSSLSLQAWLLRFLYALLSLSPIILLSCILLILCISFSCSKHAFSSDKFAFLSKTSFFLCFFVNLDTTPIHHCLKEKKPFLL